MSENNQATLEIEERGGAIVITIDRQYAVLPPDQAMEVAKCIINYVGEAKYGGATLARNTALETSRNVLVPRVVNIIRSLQEKQKSPEFIASEVVDRVLGEIL